MHFTPTSRSFHTQRMAMLRLSAEATISWGVRLKINLLLSFMNMFFFGDKDTFAIEVNLTSFERMTGKIRFWLNNEAIGDFKRNHKLSYCIKSLKNICSLQNNFYDISFENKNEQEIFTMCLLLCKSFDDLSNDEIDHKIENAIRKLFKEE